MPDEKISINGIETYILYENLTSQRESTDKTDVNRVPFVVQHGHTANHNYVKPIFDYFADHGWPVVSFDWRGHGWSEKGLSGNYTMDDCVEDLSAVYNEFLNNRFGYKKFELLGHSMGGFIALKYALKYPETLHKLVLLSTGPVLAYNFIIKIGLKFMINRYRHNYDHWFNKKKDGHEKLGLEFFPHWEDTSLMPDRDATIEFLEDMKDYDVRPQLHEIQVPTFVCVGSEDRFVRGSKTLAEKIPGAKLRIMEGYVHNIPIHARDVLPQVLMNFLESRTSSK